MLEWIPLMLALLALLLRITVMRSQSASSSERSTEGHIPRALRIVAQALSSIGAHKVRITTIGPSRSSSL